MKTENEIFEDYCKLNNISWQDKSLYKNQIKNTLNYQYYSVGVSINEAFKTFYKDISKCVKFAKSKGIIK